MMNTDKTYAEKIASEYAPKETRKVVALKKLDTQAKLPANIFAYTLGIIAALLLGVGMCLTMQIIGNGSTATMVLGVIVGVIADNICFKGLPHNPSNKMKLVSFCSVRFVGYMAGSM